jgi:protein SCO1/2
VKRLVIAFVMLTSLVACGGQRELAGYIRTPNPSLDGVTLPVLGTAAGERELIAAPNGLLIVYFGYTNCPDVCPTTMSDLRAALREVDEADRVEVAMVTVDPNRDIPILPDYVQSFFPDGIALGTTDARELAAAADIFGASYSVTSNDDGEIEVAHSGSLYAVDDTGGLLITWPFGLDRDALRADIDDLLAGRRA